MKSGLWLLGALRMGAGRQGRNIHSGPREGTFEFLPPMRDVPGGAVAVDHAHRNRPSIGELMKNSRRNIHCLPGFDRDALLAQAHFTVSLDDKINLFLLLV